MLFLLLYKFLCLKKEEEEKSRRERKQMLNQNEKLFALKIKNDLYQVFKSSLFFYVYIHSICKFLKKL